MTDLDLPYKWDRHPYTYAIALGQSVGGFVRVMGWALNEKTGTAGGTVTIYDSPDTSDPLPIVVGFAPGQTVRDWFGPQGVRFDSGLNTVVSAGSVGGKLFISTQLEGPP